jgi:hypothetical protein
MTNLMDDFAHLNTMTPVQLFERRSALIGAAPNGDFKQLTDEALQELVAIARVLRKKVTPQSRITGGKRAPAPTLDSL